MLPRYQANCLRGKTYFNKSTKYEQISVSGGMEITVQKQASGLEKERLKAVDQRRKRRLKELNYGMTSCFSPYLLKDKSTRQHHCKTE